MSAILLKTRELCQAILDHPDYHSIRDRIESFQADGQVQSQYQSLVEAGEVLQQKQQTGNALSSEEIADFEKKRESLLQSPIARNFMDAQQDMHRMREEVTRYVNRTFELGRVPEAEDLQSCGHGCNCGH